MSIWDFAQRPRRRSSRLPHLSIDGPFAAASACLGLGALALFWLAASPDGTGPGGVLIALTGMLLLALTPVLVVIASNGAIRELPRPFSRGWRRSLVGAAGLFQLWWVLVASSSLSAPAAFIFVPTMLLGAAALIATPGSRSPGAVLFFASSIAVWLASLGFFGLRAASGIAT
jgi:hypothetical protein